MVYVVTLCIIMETPQKFISRLVNFAALKCHSIQRLRNNKKLINPAKYLDDQIIETLFDMKLGETNDSKYILWDSEYS
jgi:hypothetical protein